MPDFETRTFPATLDCRYLLQAPPAPAAESALIVTLHGFSANPESMLRLTRILFGDNHWIAALQGPNQFFLNSASQEVGYAWITNQNPAPSIRLHHDMVRRVLHDVSTAHGIPVSRRILAGFSQPVGLNYRFAATFPDEIRGVAGICGGLPGNWERGPYGDVTAAVLHIATREDEFYPPAVTGQYEQRLKLRAADVEFHLFDGGHRMPASARSVVQSWMGRILTR